MDGESRVGILEEVYSQSYFSVKYMHAKANSHIVVTGQGDAALHMYYKSTTGRGSDRLKHWLELS